MLLQSDKKTLKAYPILDTTIPYISPRSQFYPLTPVNLGKPLVESLTSYICRLATAHHLSFGLFYEYTLVPSLDKSYLKTPSHVGPAGTLTSSFRHRSKNINGLGTLAHKWVELIESLTLRRDLKFLTLTASTNVLPPWKLIRSFQAWCPACYEEMRQSGGTIYQPLIWAIAVVEICSRHHNRLLRCCPYCHNYLLPLTRRICIGYCTRCGYWLGKSTEESIAESNLLTDRELDWQLSVISNIGNLLVALPDIDSSINRENIAESLRLCVERSTGGKITHFAALLGKPLLTVSGWYKGKIRLPLAELLRICYCLDLSILDFLKGGDNIDGSKLTKRDWANLTGIIKKRSRPKPFDVCKIEAKLRVFLEIEPPISMAEAGRRLEYRHGELHKNFPELSRNISSRYRRYLTKIYEAKRIERGEEIRQAVIQIHQQGVYPTARLVAELLKKPTYYGRRDVAVVIRKTREELDSKNR